MTDHIIWHAMDVMHARLVAITAGSSHQYGAYNFTPAVVFKGRIYMSAGTEATADQFPAYGITAEPVEPQSYTQGGSGYTAEVSITVTARYEITDYTDQDRAGWQCVADITAAILIRRRGRETLDGIVTELQLESQIVGVSPEDQTGMATITFLARLSRAAGQP